MQVTVKKTMKVDGPSGIRQVEPGETVDASSWSRRVVRALTNRGYIEAPTSKDSGQILSSAVKKKRGRPRKNPEAS